MRGPILMAKKDEESSFIKKAAWAAVFLVIWQNLTDAIPFSTFEFWAIKGTPWQWLGSAWPWFVWATCVNTVGYILQRNNATSDLTPKEVLKGGFLVSLWAGVMEEICFRWLIFLNAIVSVKILNWLLLGFADYGIPEWLYLHILGPVANFFTLGNLTPYLFHAESWAVGAAMLGANAMFRDGHKYQGKFGWIHSWFAGMFLFWMMFTYGLVAAITIHFLYDMLIFVLWALFIRIDERR